MLIWAGGGAGAVMGIISLATYMGIDPLPWPKKSEIEAHTRAVVESVSKERDRIDALLVQMEVAASDRNDLRKRSLINEQLHVQNQIWQAERELRQYQRERQPVPDSIRREIENNRKRYHDIQKDIDRLK